MRPKLLLSAADNAWAESLAIICLIYLKINLLCV